MRRKLNFKSRDKKAKCNGSVWSPTWMSRCCSMAERASTGVAHSLSEVALWKTEKFEPLSWNLFIISYRARRKCVTKPSAFSGGTGRDSPFEYAAHVIILMSCSSTCKKNMRNGKKQRRTAAGQDDNQHKFNMHMVTQLHKSHHQEPKKEVGWTCWWPKFAEGFCNQSDEPVVWHPCLLL